MRLRSDNGVPALLEKSQFSAAVSPGIAGNEPAALTCVLKTSISIGGIGHLTRASFRLSRVDLSPADGTLDFENAPVEINVRHLQSENLPDPQSSGDG